MAKKLRTLTHPDFTTTGRALTHEELDQNFIELWQAIEAGGGGTADTTRPTYASSVLAADGVSLDVTLTESGSPPILPSTGITGFTVTVAGSSRAISSAVRQSDVVVRLTLASAANTGEAVTVAYAPGNVTDSQGNSMLSFAAKTVTNNSTQGSTGGPTLVSAYLWPDGLTFHLTFNEPLLPTGAGGAANFKVYVDGVEKTGKNGDVLPDPDNEIYRMVFAAAGGAIPAGAVVTVEYLGGYLTDVDGNAAPAFGPQPVTNDSTQP